MGTGCTSAGNGEDPDAADAAGGAEASEPEESDDGGTGTVLQPDGPGDPNQTVDPDATVDSAGWNDADAAFLTEMIPHHAQAVEMAELAETRAEDPETLAMARRIGDAQAAEITGMAGWLDRHGLPVPTAADVEDHLQMGMSGMLSPDQMAALEEARGHRFDVLFVAGMIRHHEGAVAMAREVLREGSDVLVGEIASDVLAAQSAEVGRLRDIGRRLS